VAQRATNDDAIIEGLSNTGGVVTSAALIMVAALSGLVLGHIAGLQELGIGLAFGVLVDATLVRGLLLPSIMTLLGPRTGGCPLARRRFYVSLPRPSRFKRRAVSRVGEAIT